MAKVQPKRRAGKGTKESAQARTLPIPGTERGQLALPGLAGVASPKVASKRPRAPEQRPGDQPRTVSPPVASCSRPPGARQLRAGRVRWLRGKKRPGWRLLCAVGGPGFAGCTWPAMFRGIFGWWGGGGLEGDGRSGAGLCPFSPRDASGPDHATAENPADSDGRTEWGAFL
jgi:hypothetical protein